MIHRSVLQMHDFERCISTIRGRSEVPIEEVPCAAIELARLPVHESSHLVFISDCANIWLSTTSSFHLHLQTPRSKTRKPVPCCSIDRGLGKSATPPLPP